MPVCGEVHVWQVALEVVAQQTALLSPEERTRAARFVREEPRKTFIASRCALRRVLSGYIDEAPARILITTDANGKPRLAHHDVLHFNLSHSGHLGLVAVASTPVGIDIETDGRRLDVDALSARFFHPAEQSAVRQAAEPEAAFLAVWTAKEAAVKAAGLGLRVELASFDVSPSADMAPCETRIPAGEAHGYADSRIFVQPIEIPGAAASVASVSPIKTLLFYELL